MMMMIIIIIIFNELGRIEAEDTVTCFKKLQQ
jgi:hypothetical protein